MTPRFFAWYTAAMSAAISFLMLLVSVAPESARGMAIAQAVFVGIAVVFAGIGFALGRVPDGIRCEFHSPGQLVVSAQVGPVWPNRGNSFWVTFRANEWCLFTWSPVGYWVPPAVDIADLCRACMALAGPAMGRAPEEITAPFGLRELTEAEAEAVFDELGLSG